MENILNTTNPFLPLVYHDGMQYTPHFAFYGSEWEGWYQRTDTNQRIDQKIIMNVYADTIAIAIRKLAANAFNSDCELLYQQK